MELGEFRPLECNLAFRRNRGRLMVPSAPTWASANRVIPDLETEYVRELTSTKPQEHDSPVAVDVRYASQSTPTSGFLAGGLRRRRSDRQDPRTYLRLGESAAYSCNFWTLAVASPVYLFVAR